MSPLAHLIVLLDEEIQDPEEETFLLYAQDFPSQNLGFIDPKADCVDVAVGGRDYTIYQSPTVLSSSRQGGTTGAVLWRITPSFASWLSHPSNPLFTSSLLTPPSSASILELGCGVSPLNALSLARSRLVRLYILTDQPYVQKLLRRNLAANLPPPSHSSSRRSPAHPHAHAHAPPTTAAAVAFATLDWETDHVSPALTGDPHVRSFDAVLACDCVYNYALVEPFVQTCADACRLRTADDADRETPCVCVVAQQLRNDDVFGTWLARFHRDFRVWRVPNERLPEELRTSAGFAVHIGVLRESQQ